jgi:hypothetical protein
MIILFFNKKKQQVACQQLTGGVQHIMGLFLAAMSFFCARDN